MGLIVGHSPFSALFSKFFHSLVVSAGLLMAVSTVRLTINTAYANPEGGVVSAGSADIISSDRRVDVHQSTDKAVIDWRSFNIDRGETTQFHQPSSVSFTLNRVNDVNPSSINGLLKANGNIMIVNPNGIVFGRDSVVDVSGLVATTANIKNEDFMTDRMIFNQPGLSTAKIINEGSITAKEAGLVSLVAPEVHNSGVISARLGGINLGATDTFTLDMAGDGLIKVSVDKNSSAGKKIINSSQLIAEGGVIALTAATAHFAVDYLTEKNSSAVEAQSLTISGDKVVLSSIENSGSIIADSKNTGGKISLKAESVSLKNGSKATASGSFGGGKILVGIDEDGSVVSETLNVEKGAEIIADAIEKGDGGTILTWGAQENNFAGHIQAKGGAKGGNGGFVEVSSFEGLNFTGSVDTTAPLGETGTFLLDPTNLTVSNAANASVTGSTPFQPSANNATSNLNIGTLQTALASSNVVVQTRNGGSQAGTLTVQDAITWSANNTLTLDAHSTLTINAPITATNRLTLSTSGDVVLNANLSAGVGGAGLSIVSKSGSNTIGVAGGAGTVNLSTTDLGFIQDGWSDITIGSISGSGAMTVNAYTWTDPLILRSGTGAITVAGAQTMGANNLTIDTAANPTINAALTGSGTLSFTPSSAATSIGLAGGSGTFSLTTTELANITDGWSNIFIGSTTGSGALTANAATWSDNLTLRTGTGVVTIAGAQTMGANNLTVETSGNMAINAALSGSGTLIIRPTSISTSIGLAGATGTLALTALELSNITNGWSDIIIGRTDATASLAVNAATWNDNLTLRTGSGTITISGTQTIGSNNLTFETSGNPTINGALTGSGTLTFMPGTAATTVGLAGGSGTFALTALELANITNGWSDIIIGRTDGTAAMTVNAATWNDNLTLRTGSGVMTIAGAQTMGTNNLTLETNGNPALNSTLTGTGVLTIRPIAGSSTSIGTAGAVGTLALSTAELNNILTGWSEIVIGRTDSNSPVLMSAYTWDDPVRILTGQDITINGAQSTTVEAGTSMVFAGANFINNAGATAFDNIGSSRYLVYSTNPASNTLGGLTGFTKRYNKTYAGYGPGSVVETGNVFLYSIAPILSISVNDGTREYGEPNSFTNGYSGFIDGDTVLSALTGSLSYSTAATVNSIPGTYGVTGTLGTLASPLGYQLNIIDPTADLTITPAVLTITADDQVREYGDANPALTVGYSGFKNGEDEGDLASVPVASTLADAFSIPDDYAITLAGGSDVRYTYTLVDGILQIRAAPLTITAEDQTRVYGDSNPELTLAFNGFKNGERSGDLAFLPMVSTTASESSIPDVYPITLMGGGDVRYTYALIDGVLTVTKRPLTVTANNVVITAGQTPALSLMYNNFASPTGFFPGDDESDLSQQPTIMTTAPSFSIAGAYDIIPSGAIDDRYDFVYVNGRLTILPSATPDPTQSGSIVGVHYPLTVEASLNGNIVLEEDDWLGSDTVVKCNLPGMSANCSMQ